MFVRYRPDGGEARLAQVETPPWREGGEWLVGLRGEGACPLSKCKREDKPA